MRPGDQPTNYSDEDDDVSTDKPQGGEGGESEKKSADNLRKRITNVTSEGTEEPKPEEAATAPTTDK